MHAGQVSRRGVGLEHRVLRGPITLICHTWSIKLTRAKPAFSATMTTRRRSRARLGGPPGPGEISDAQPDPHNRDRSSRTATIDGISPECRQARRRNAAAPCDHCQQTPTGTSYPAATGIDRGASGRGSGTCPLRPVVLSGSSAVGPRRTRQGASAAGRAILGDVRCCVTTSMAADSVGIVMHRSGWLTPFAADCCTVSG